MSFIASIIKNKILNKVLTTNDLVYKEKTVDIHNIQKSYDDLCSNNESIRNVLKYGDQYYFYNKSFSNVLILAVLNFKMQDSLESEDNKLSNVKISEIHNSLWIEGVRSSKKKIKQLINNNSYKNKKDDINDVIVNNFNSALNFILDTDDINENNFFALYTILSKDIDMEDNQLDGFPYRKEDVEIGNEGIKGIAPVNIKSSMDQIFNFIKNENDFVYGNTNINFFNFTIKKIHNFINGLLIHLNFEHIHPYYDMNGRMGRLLTLWFMKKTGVFFEGLYFSEAINLFKHNLYYSAFKSIKLNTFKFDATYFVGSLLTALLAHKICLAETDLIKNKVQKKYKKNINSFEKSILINLLSKEKNKFYKSSDFILGIEDINPAIVSKSLSKLVSLKVLEEINSKPKEYKLILDKDIESRINEIYLNYE